MGNHQTASLLTDNDLYLFNEGSHFRLPDKLGAHVDKTGAPFQTPHGPINGRSQACIRVACEPNGEGSLNRESGLAELN